MKLIWTKSKQPLSLLIRWGLNEPCSHFAIVFDEDRGGIVFESNLKGSNIRYYPTFKKKCEVVREIDIPLSLEKEEKVYHSILDVYDSKSYDYTAFAYFVWRAFLKKCFGVPLPKKNKWNTKDSYICVGLALALKERSVDLPVHLAVALESIPDFEMISPEQLYQKLITKNTNSTETKE